VYSFGPRGAVKIANRSVGKMISRHKSSEDERRKWPRLPLAIPVFVRTADENGKDLLEFATALNVSAGGALIAVRRALPVTALVSLEIPSAPLMPTSTLPKAARNLRAKAMWDAHANGYQLLGVKFSHPLTEISSDRRRKVTSSM
jgi:PilZ domain